MKKLIFAFLLFVAFGSLQAQTPNAQILDTEKDIINDLTFAPAQSNKSLNNGQMIELRECVFHGYGLPSSKPKTRVLRYTLWYYTQVNASGEPTQWKSVTYEIDMRQQLTVAYQNNSLVITCSTVNGQVYEGNNLALTQQGSIPTQGRTVKSLKVITIPDVTTGRLYANKASLLRFKFAALKMHIDRFYK